MDVVYVHSTPARRQGLSSESLSGGHHVPLAQRDDDEVQPGGEHSNFQHNHTAESRRQWSVTIAVNDHDAVPATITDPFSETEYEKIFEHYLRDSDRPRWSAESMSMTLQESTVGGVSHLEERIRWYGEHLLSQLKLSFSPDATECQIYIVESDPDPSETADRGPGLHCLAWELLEADHVARMPKLRVTRISDVPPPLRQLRSMRPTHRPPPLAAVQANPALNFHVLLVVARDFSRSGAERDPEPDLAQWPLMSVQRKMHSRLLLEVVRPGSREELAGHLDVRAAQGVHFHLVHFDLHGRIMSDEYVIHPFPILRLC